MTSSEIINQFALAVIAGCFLLNFWLVFFVYNRSIVNENRLDVLDRVSSSFTDDEFDSRAIAAGDQPLPSTKHIRSMIRHYSNGHEKA